MDTTSPFSSPFASSLSRSRRAFVGRGALVGTAGLVADGLGLGLGPRSRRTAAQGGLTGEITVSFADDTGIRQSYVAQAAEAVQAANPGATVAVEASESSSGEFTTRLLLGMRTGETPDVFQLTGTALGVLAAGGSILPLDPYVGAWPDWEVYPQPVKDAVTFAGQTWAIPYGLDVNYLYYRRDVFEQAGLARDWQPANVGAILDAALAVKAQVPDVLPYAIYAGEVGSTGSAVRGLLPLIWAYGGELTDAEGKWIIDSPAIRNAFAYYARAYLGDELVPRQLLSAPDPAGAMKQRIGSGKLALLFEGAWAYGPWRDEDPATAAEQIGHVLHPTESGGPPFTVGGAGNVWFVSATCQHPDLAWEFLKTLNTKEIVAALAIADPHPAARSDAMEVPGYQADAFLLQATADLATARFAPPSPFYLDLIPIIQRATGLVASGETGPEDAAARYAEDLKRVLGEDNVVTQV